LFCAVWWLADGRIPDTLPARALTAIVYLGSVGSVLGFLLYYYLIKHMDTARIALVTLVTPVLALLLGHSLNGEVILPQEWAGAGCILLGLGVHRWGAQAWRRGSV
jgi:drug/metabolite transporter (DMT)-like permease